MLPHGILIFSGRNRRIRFSNRRFAGCK